MQESSGGMDITAPSELFRELFIAIAEVEDTGSAQASFFKAGRRLGPRIASSLDELASTIKDRGWGVLSIKRSRNAYTATLRGTLFTALEAERGVCSFYAGMLSGVAEVQDKKRTVFIERKCVACGDPSCVFESVGG